jgi:hypothetical protein
MARREPVRLLHPRNVCFWHKADITIAWNHVRFRGKADIGKTSVNVRF